MRPAVAAKINEQVKSKRMTEAPIKLPQGHSIPVLSNGEIATLLDHEDTAQRPERDRVVN